MTLTKLKLIIIFVFLFLTNFLLSDAYGEFSISRQDPLGDRYDKINANFGQFRSRTKAYKIHDGMDYRAGIGTPIYPVEPGTANIHSADDSLWGKYVIVNHGTYQTRYAHLHSISVTTGEVVTTSTTLGVSGATDGGADEYSPHLHFGLGSPNVSTANTKNPIVEGLKQPLYGELKIIKDKRFDHKINLLGTGPDGTFAGDNDSRQIINPGDPIRAIIEAYQKDNLHFNPYKVEFEIENLTDSSWPKKTKTIEFNNMQDILAKLEHSEDGYYCFSKPFVTNVSSEADYADYYFVKFYPSAGIYKITASIYSCYRDDFGFHLSEPETVTRHVVVGWVGVDFNHIGYPVAWLPDDLSGRIGTAIAAAAVPGEGMRAATVGEELPEVFYAFANNRIITSNFLDVSPNFQKNALIESRCTPEADWLVQVYNSSGNEVDRITVDGEEWLRVEWGESKPAGTYTFTVTASNSAGITTYESYDSIVIDNAKPLAFVSMIDNHITATGGSIKANIRPDEDLYSCLVNVVKDSDYSLVQERIYTNPSINKDETVTVEWYDAPGFANGYYRLQFVMVDLAGNIAKSYSPIVSVDKMGNLPPPVTTETYVYDPTLPDLPKWGDRPLVSDVAFDSAKNMYILYGRFDRLVKYSSDGTVISSVEEFRLPLGLTVSPSGDRVYVADTYNNRVLIYDNDLNSVREIKGASVYMTFGEVNTYYWLFGVNIHDQSGGAGKGNKYDFGEGFDLPMDVVLGRDRISVVDKNKHRVLRYDNDGVAEIFPVLKANLREEARSAFNRIDARAFGIPVSGRTVEKALFYSNSLNDSIVFDPNSVDKSRWDRGWMRVMYTHSNPSGSESGQFTSPSCVDADSSGNLYVADTGNNRIQKFNPDGMFVAAFGEGELNSPKGIDVDSYGNIFVADTGKQRIVQFDPLGEFVKEYKSDEYAIDPQKLEVKNGKIYIADANSGRPLIWNIAGDIINMGISESWFSPNGDGEKDNIGISYDLSQPADVTIQLIPKSSGASAAGSGGGIALNKASRNIGNNLETWGGLIQPTGSSMQSLDSSQQSVIADGNYTLKIIAAFGDYIKTRSIDVNVDTAGPSLALSRAPPEISPNADAVNDNLIIDYSISDDRSPTSEVKISLWKNGRVIDVLLDEEMETGTQPSASSLVWNGIIGRYVIEGNYILELKATDLAGNYSTATTEVLVDFQPPRIESLNVSNEYFSPNDDDIKDNTEIKFDLYDTYADKMLVSALVLNEKDEEVAEIIWKKELSAGEHTLSWDGRTNSGELAPDAKYKIEVYAEDGAGNLGISEPVAAVVDTVPAEIINLAADPNPFTPNNDGIKDRTSFSYVFSEPCNAELRIFRDDGTTLFRDYRHYNITDGSFGWNGTGFHGEILGEEHPYYLYAEDRAGNVTTSESQIIVVDHVPSLVPYAFADPDPFSPVNPANNFTDIKYYLSRDDLTVDLAIVGREGRVIKNLVNNQVQSKGEHSVRWYGDFGSSYDGPRLGSKIADGSWEFRVSATADDGSNPCNTSNTVLVDNIPPHIMLAPLEVDRFNKTATLKYSVPETVSIEVSVFDDNDDLISMLEDRSFRSPGDYSLAYDFSEDEEQDAGNRYFRIVAVDRAKNIAEKISEVFAVNPDALQITGSQVTPSIFTPNGDGLTDLTRITYALSGGYPDYMVNIDILTPTGSTVKSLIENEPQGPGTYSFYWDGLTDSKQLAADGYYEYVVIAEDRLGTRVEGGGAMLVVSTRPTVDISTSPPIFSPNGDGSKDRVVFNYAIDYPIAYITGEALVELQVLNASGEAVWSKIFDHTPGTYAYEYDGQTSGKEQLPAGNYYVKASAQDALGSTAVPKTVEFRVDYEKPVVAIAEISPNPFSPDPNGIKDETAMAYTVSKDSDVTVRIKDSTGSVIKELLESERVSASQIRAAAIPTVIWDGRDTSGSIVSDGNYEIFISALDDAGNTGEALAEVVVDNNTNYSSDLPPIRNLDIEPFYAKEGSKIIVDFSASEELLEQPTVYVGGYLADYEGSEKLSDTRYDYHFSHIIGDDPEGNTRVYIEITDLAGNVSSTEAEIVVDKTVPEINSLSADPDPATVGEVVIGFTGSEPLEEAPKVYVTQKGSVPQLAAVGGNWVETNGRIEAKYSAVSGYDGPALITVEGVDLAGNTFVYSFNDSLAVDTILPFFSDIQSEIESNPEFTKFAKEGSVATIRFKTAEELQFNPDVKINDNPADYDSLNLNEYTYKYTISSSDTNGNAAISISGFDFAGNEGFAETFSSSESFVVDLIKPTVTIAEDPGMIANPSPFSTNASSEVGHRQTRLSYEISEQGYVTIGIHKVPNDKTVYIRDDFNDNNLIISFDENWLSQGEHYIYWDGTIQHNQSAYDLNSNGFADPGKYAFIVEVKDRAGNLIEGKWGGTCWIQDNLLKLVSPDQFLNNNPDPGFFSPNGDGSLDSTEIHFRVDLGVIPAECATPEKISVLGLPGDFKWLSGVVKKIGTYTVRVYDESKTTLIRTIVAGADLYSNTVLAETWDGKDDTGTYVPEGNYKIEIDARDFIGGQAVDNLLTLDVTVDNSIPRVVSYEPDLANTPWSNTGKAYNVDFFDDHNSYASKLNYAQYKITTGPNQSGSLQKDWDDIPFTKGSASYADDWGDWIFSECGQGTYYVSVKVLDIAGNENVVNDVFYVKKDTNGPSVSTPSTSTPTNNQRPTWIWSASSDMSGIQGYFIKLTNSSGGTVVGETWIGNTTSWTTTTDLGDGTYYAAIKARDNAGNTGSYSSLGQVTVDISPPQITSISDSPDPCSPGNIDENKDILTFNFTINETADIVKIYVDGSERYGGQGFGAGSHSIDCSDAFSLTEEEHSYYIYAVDGVGNSGQSSAYYFTVDNTVPTISSVSASPYIFTPDGDGTCDTTTISYALSETASAAITIKDRNGSSIRTLDGGVSSCSWNGRNDSGSLAGNGLYTYYIDAEDDAGNPALQKSGKIMTKGKDEVALIDNNGDPPDHILLYENLYDAGSYNAYYKKITDSDYREFWGITTLDYNGDGVEALAVVDHNGDPPDYIRIYNPRNGNAIKYISGNYSGNITAGDFNGDGIDEIAVTDSNAPPELKIYNSQTGALIHSFKLDLECWRIAAGDFDGDGIDEIAVIDNNGSPPDWILLYEPLSATGYNDYYLKISDSDYREFWGITALDCDGDGKDEIAITDNNGSLPDYIRIYNAQNGSPIKYIASGLSGYITAGDFDGDGRDEVVITGRTSPKVMYIYNSQTGALIHGFSLDYDCRRIAAGDFNGLSGVPALSVDTNKATQSTTLEAPTLIAPEDEEEVVTLRPTFKWKHHKLDTQEYKIDLAKNDTFSIDHQAFDKSANTGSTDKDDPSLYHYTYSIHEFDPGLDRDTYYWKVTAIATSESATSEVRSFSITPELTLTGITNYPNPFNPNREATKIRYRLGATADEVKVRIYDITGSLVIQIDNCPTAGEGSSVWDKYQDVEWNGRNGRGDMVVNGIYPFEVIARLGDKTVSGRGKVAVLK